MSGFNLLISVITFLALSQGKQVIHILAEKPKDHKCVLKDESRITLKMNEDTQTTVMTETVDAILWLRPPGDRTHE